MVMAETGNAMVVSPKAPDVEKLAGDELFSHLKPLYPHAGSPIAAPRTGNDPAVLVGTSAILPELNRYLQSERARTPESAVVTRSGSGQSSPARISAAASSLRWELADRSLAATSAAL